MIAVLYIVLAWLLTVATCVALGGWVKRAFGLSIDGWEDLLYRFLLGAVALSGLVFALSSLELIYKGSIYAVAILSILSSGRDWPKLPRPPWHWTAIPFLIYAIFYLAHAMAPEHSPDGMSYHLGLVARYYREHGFAAFPANMYAFLSQGLEMLFLFAFAMGRHSAAAMVHFTFLLALPVLLAVHAGRNGWLAGLTVFLLPVVGIDGVSAYNDVALAVVFFAIWHAMERWRSTGVAGWVSVAALLAGFAFAIKFTGCLSMLLLAPAWRLWPRGLLAAIPALPWLVRSYVGSGNPFAPFFNYWFPNPWFNTEFEIGYRTFLRHYDLSGFGEWAREIFLGGPRLSGTLGPLGILLPLALIGIRKRPRLLAAALIALVIYPLNVGTRFLIPGVPFLMLALVETFPRAALGLPLLAAILSWPSVFALYSSPYTWFLERIPWRAALRIESEDGFLTRKSGGYVTARAIERFVPAGESVFAWSPIPESYTSRNILVSYQSTLGLKLQQALIAPTYPDYQARFLYRCPSGDLTIAKSSPDTWSVNEIEPKPDSITCNRSPWDTRLMIDRNWTTRWRTWGPTFAGDSCRLTPAQPYNVWGTADQWQVELRGCTRSIEENPADYRQEAQRLFLENRVVYLAIDAPDYPSKDMIDNARLWPLDLVAERGTMRIYRWRGSMRP